MKAQIVQYPQLGQKSQDVIFKITKTRNIRIAVKSNLQITVSFNKYCSAKKAREFFESKIIWVQNSLQRMAVKQQIHSSNTKINFPKLTTEEFLDRKHYLILRCKQLAEIYNFAIKKIVVRNQKTIWGSCSARNNISLNSNLVFLNSDLIDYVILHELVHTQVKNHSKRFWGRLEQVLPNCRLLNQQLRRFVPSFDGRF